MTIATTSHRVGLPRFLILAMLVLDSHPNRHIGHALDQKMQQYRGNGVRLGWLLIPAKPQVRVYRPNALPITLDGPTEIDGDDVLIGLRLDLRPIWQTVL